MDDAPDFVMGLPLGSVFLIVGMYALFAHFVRRGYGLSLSPWFAFMAICLGIAQLIERNLMLMPPGQAAWWNHLGLLTILLFPVGLWRFIELSLGSGRLNLIRRCWQLQVLVVALIWLPHFFDWVPYERFGLQVANGAIGLQLLVGIGEGVRNLSRQEPGKRIIALGMLIFSLTGLMDIMVAFLQVDVGLELYPWGMLALILVLAFGQERAAGEAHLQLQAKTLALQRHQQELEQTVARRTAELRLATRAAQAASRAKSDFLANMSHELRTPLNAILGYAQLFQRDATLSEERTSQAAVMRQSGEHLLTLINDILDISKIEAGKLEIVPGETHLLPLIQLVSDMIEPRARAKGLEFHRDVQQSLPECVVTDGKRVRQILLNLLSNAVKFTSHGSAHLAVLRENRKLVFRVSDTGIGIAPEHLGAIFMPFQQVGSAVNPAQGGPKAGLNNGSNTAEDASYSEGAGLGLAISRNIARKMDGDIFVHSEPGRGSSFCLELPCIPAKGDLTQEHPAGLCVVGIRGACREIVAVDRQENALPPMDSGPIPAPWPPDFDHLQKAARIGDVREVLREGERLKARFPEHQAALDRVLQLAAEFEILALQRLLGVTTSTAK